MIPRPEASLLYLMAAMWALPAAAFWLLRHLNRTPEEG